MLAIWQTACTIRLRHVGKRIIFGSCFAVAAGVVAGATDFRDEHWLRDAAACPTPASSNSRAAKKSLADWLNGERPRGFSFLEWAC